MSEDRETCVTTRHDDGLEYSYPPTFDHEVGDLAIIGDTWELFINGELRSVPILYLEITSRTREYVVDEDHWYINYHVEHYDHKAEHVLTVSLSKDDVSRQPFGDSQGAETVRDKIEELAEV